MPFFGRNKSNADMSANSPSESADKFKAHYLDMIQQLITYLKEFALDIKEIDSEQFKSQLDEFKNNYIAESSFKQQTKLLNQHTPQIELYIKHQHAYLNDREKEFRDIIDLLSKAMTGINTDNHKFYHRLNDHSTKLEQITLLDDIKKIKNALELEVTQLRQMVSDQKRMENQKIETLSNQVDSLKIELEKTRAQMETDALTGVNNRKAFDLYLENLTEKSRLHKLSFALLLLDVDDFKQINDNYGHLVGDRVLVAFAQKCRSLVRSDDFIARYGGEEFVIILPNASFRNAKKKAKQICKSLATTRYSIEESGDGNYINVTTSIGVASLNKTDQMADIVDRADKALYLAKRNGKNCVFTEKDL